MSQSTAFVQILPSIMRNLCFHSFPPSRELTQHRATCALCCLYLSQAWFILLPPAQPLYWNYPLKPPTTKYIGFHILLRMTPDHLCMEHQYDSKVIHAKTLFSAVCLQYLDWWSLVSATEKCHIQQKCVGFDVFVEPPKNSTRLRHSSPEKETLFLILSTL